MKKQKVPEHEIWIGLTLVFMLLIGLGFEYRCRISTWEEKFDLTNAECVEWKGVGIDLYSDCVVELHHKYLSIADEKCVDGVTKRNCSISIFKEIVEDHKDECRYVCTKHCNEHGYCEVVE